LGREGPNPNPNWAEKDPAWGNEPWEAYQELKAEHAETVVLWGKAKGTNTNLRARNAELQESYKKEQVVYLQSQKHLNKMKLRVLSRAVRKTVTKKNVLERQEKGLHGWRDNVYEAKAHGWQSRATIAVWEFRQSLQAHEGMTQPGMVLPNVARHQP
jgi:hypothetical protein